ncbi:transglycosylase domain-containing protein [Nonomuraea rhizosphaerae]|uniref:transglycosylase domain-containing protein n=1 Tax=Nonomuraea rhizosphaerae TaxID=2665663 RepID=UPI001C5F8269|nr:transglycosylase domain-containing protein [Nonomuraea rhizosphaerae]
MPQGSAPQTGEQGWGSGDPQRRPEAAYEQTGAMAAQSYGSPQDPRQHDPRQDPRQHDPRQQPQAPREPGPRPGSRRAARAAQGERDTRARSNQETMVGGEVPRRSRGRGSNPPPGGPGGPGGPKGPGGPGKPDKPKWRRFIPSWKIVMASMTILAAGIFGMIAVAYANTEVPNETQASATAQGSTIYYRDGKTIIAKLGTPRKIVPINEMADVVKDATVAIENDTFYEDSGISIQGMARSLWMTATGQQLQGASTITQQMARGYYDGLSQEVSIKRKVSEIFIAVKLDQQKSKEEILQIYLNTINFGRAYGIEAASQAYFGKKAKDLTLAQGAYLAAHIQTPSWEPDAPALKNRFQTVLQYMARQWPDKYAEKVKTATFPKVKKSNTESQMGGINGYMVDAVLRELKQQRGLTEDVIKSNGYKIVTTFDKNLMQAAKTAVLSNTSGLSREFHTSLAAVNPKNGQVVAFYGGTNYLKDSWNEPFDSAKQAASAFKPYTLAAWLQAGYSLKSWVPGSESVPKLIPGFERGLRNSHNLPASIDVVKATAQSVNTAYASMAYALPGKIDDLKNLVEAAGFSKDRVAEDIKAHNYQFAIGSVPVTAVEQAAGYSIFANEGKYTHYHVVKEVRLSNNLVAYPEQKSSKAVISPDAAADATVALQEVLRSGTAAGKGLGNRPSAGKTGTNNEEKEAWFVGYTPQFSTAVGMYREECWTTTKSGKKIKRVTPTQANCPITPRYKPSKKYNNDNPYTRPFETSLGFEGADRPTSVWRAFMLAAHQNKPVEQFPTRSDSGTPENIVPSPTPTPTPTPDDPSLDDPRNDDATCGVVPPCTDDSDQIITVDPNENGQPDQDGGQFDGRGRQGTNPGRVPEPMPSPSRRELW